MNQNISWKSEKGKNQELFWESEEKQASKIILRIWKTSDFYQEFNIIQLRGNEKPH